MSRIMNVVANSRNIICFVCDQKITGEKVNLASSYSTHSKVTLPEKISQLIGDDYVVAVTEQDCVCKRCASLLNHMDKLENELSMVKKALTNNISNKYKINFDGQTNIQPLSNGNLKTDSASDYEDEGRRNNADNNSSLVKKKLSPINKVIQSPPIKPPKPAENVTKLKIYKCGFCSYQSKELSNVRMHMKIHIKASRNEGDGDKAAATPSPMLTPAKPALSVRRRVFRCQVCSASFDDRNKCLDHISRDHTAAGRKMVEQKQSQEEPLQTQNNKATESLTESSGQQPSRTESADTTKQEQEQKELDDTATHDEMDTSEPPPSIALYSCDTCSSNFDNDLDFANHVNEHVKSEGSNAEQKVTNMEVEGTPKTQPDFAQISSQSENQENNDNETPKEPDIGLDIEAMIAAMHSEGPESAADSMPSI